MDTVSTTSEFEVVDASGELVEKKKEEEEVVMVEEQQEESEPIPHEPLIQECALNLDPEPFWHTYTVPTNDPRNRAGIRVVIDSKAFTFQLKIEKKQAKIALALTGAMCSIIFLLAVLNGAFQKPEVYTSSIFIQTLTPPFNHYFFSLAFALQFRLTERVKYYMSSQDGIAWSFNSRNFSGNYSWRPVDEISDNVVDYLLAIRQHNSSVEPFVFEKIESFPKDKVFDNRFHVEFANTTYDLKAGYELLLKHTNNTELHYFHIGTLYDVRRDLVTGERATKSRMISAGQLYVTLKWNGIIATRVYLLHEEKAGVLEEGKKTRTLFP